MRDPGTAKPERDGTNGPKEAGKVELPPDVEYFPNVGEELPSRTQ